MKTSTAEWKDGGPTAAVPTAATERVLLVLEAFDASDSALTVTEIALRVGLPVSTIHRLLQTLCRLGYVERDRDSKRYRLGLRLFELAGRAIAQHGVREVARPYLLRLAEQAEETAQLAVLYGGEALYIDMVEGPEHLRVSTSVGGRTPLHCTAMGKALLAFQPEGVLKQVLQAGLPRLTPLTTTDPDQLRTELEAVRTSGVAVILNEYRPGSGAVAAPIFRAGREVSAAVGIAGPLDRIEARLADLRACVTEAARQISARLL